ncbi:hypothetical protein ACHAWF_005856 [Thalassiosira exigua]
MLGFSEDHKPTVLELRHAYFEAAKRSHPDVIGTTDHGTSQPLDFRDITDAYAHLLGGGHIRGDGDSMENVVSISEEEEYRQACKEVLGLSSEIVEESKQNPMFRKWLEGKTDAVLHWRMFFAAHGGLAQKLRRPAGYLGKGGGGIVRKSETRRKRPRR